MKNKLATVDDVVVTEVELRVTSNANVEKIESGYLYGWAVSELSDQCLSLKVIVDGKIVGVGKADKFRQDLKNNGINEGYHAFEISLNNDWNQESGSVSFQLLNAETNEEIKHAPFIYEVSILKLTATIDREQHGHICCSLRSNQIIDGLVVSLYHDEKVIGTSLLESDAKDISFDIALPISLMDGNRRLFKLSVDGQPEILATAVLAVNPIRTPWQYLTESFNKPGFLSMPAQADSRYESLHFQLEAIANKTSQVSLENLLKTHKVVVEGYETRTNFPSFDLPKFSKPEVSIIVPAYNKFELTYHCIASIVLAYNKTSYEVILADDCSTDETCEAEKIIGNVVISRNPENLRFLRSCNEASKMAKGEFIIFLNNDTEVTSYWIDELVNKMKDDPSVGMTGSKLLNLDGTLQEAGGIVWKDGQPWNVGRNLNPQTPEYNYTREVDYLTGAAMCIRHELWQKVGLFSEELIPCYYEDTDLAFKVRDEGYKTVYISQSVVVHFEGQSHGTDVTKGLKRYQVINEATFRRKWYKRYRNNGIPSHQNLRFEKDRNISHRILVIDYATPMPNKDAGSYAAVQEIKLIQSLGFKVTFVPINLAHFGKFTTELQKMGVEVLYAPFYTSVNQVLHARLDEFDAVYMTRYNIASEFIPYIRENSTAKILFNNADLHFLRELRSAVRNGIDSDALQGALETRGAELGVCRDSDAVLCYNSTEHAVITSHILESDKLHITPWVLENKKEGPGFKVRQGIAFLGGFNHTPNGEAVEYLVNDIMPLLFKQRPEIILYVYGSNMPAAYKKLEKDNIKMVGFAESLDGVYHDHRVFVAPLLSGAGIKGKVLEAMAYNTPTILSEVAAEGTGLTHSISTLIAQEPQEWVNAIIKLYDDETLWLKFAENSQTLVEAKYSFEHGHKVFKNIFASVGIYSSK
jgi:GT2 family glycosyltransferase